MTVERKSLSDFAREVSDEWMAEGRISAPPDSVFPNDETEQAFFDEVERRFDAQTEEPDPLA